MKKITLDLLKHDADLSNLKDLNVLLTTLLSNFIYKINMNENIPMTTPFYIEIEPECEIDHVMRLVVYISEGEPKFMAEITLVPKEDLDDGRTLN